MENGIEGGGGKKKMGRRTFIREGVKKGALVLLGASALLSCGGGKEKKEKRREKESKRGYNYRQEINSIRSTRRDVERLKKEQTKEFSLVREGEIKKWEKWLEENDPNYHPSCSKNDAKKVKFNK